MQAPRQNTEGKVIIGLWLAMYKHIFSYYVHRSAVHNSFVNINYAVNNTNHNGHKSKAFQRLQ